MTSVNSGKAKGLGRLIAVGFSGDGPGQTDGQTACALSLSLSLPPLSLSLSLSPSLSIIFAFIPQNFCLVEGFSSGLAVLFFPHFKDTIEHSVASIVLYENSLIIQILVYLCFLALRHVQAYQA